MVQLIYIGGYGRSGSTLLETLMTANPQIVACGETLGVLRDWGKDRKCSCGRAPDACPVWGPIVSQADHENWSHRDLDLALLQVISAGGRSKMVDSSKTAWGEAFSPFKLRRALGQNFKLVHLVRDPRAVCWSIVREETKRARRKDARLNVSRFYIVGALGWLVANLACELFGTLYPQQYRRIRYEDLAKRPQPVLDTIFRELLSDQAYDLEKINDSDNRHQLFGNRVRRQPLSPADIREDEDWKDSMPSSYRRLVGLLSGVLRYRYGYV